MQAKIHKMRQQFNQRKREQQQLAVAGVNIYSIWIISKKNCSI